jgi:dolichyl-phosphate-mannose-protein mannosyltransferase
MMSLMNPTAKKSSGWKQHLLYGGVVVLLSYCTYVQGYWNPPSLFWDENYHIASAQKYMNEVYFMEPHPPLGKLLIAAGEKLWDKNEEDSSFLETDYARQLPANFSFVGYRFFPVMFAWLIAPLLYAIFFLLTKNRIFSVFLSFPYVFDNAQIVHGRGAMLDSAMSFFAVALLFLFLLLLHWKDKPNRFTPCSLLFGICLGLLLTTKALGLIMILLLPALFLFLYGRWQQYGVFFLYCLFGFLVAYIAVWHVHFRLANTVMPDLPDDGYYQASETYKYILDTGQTASPYAFTVQLKDSLKFLTHYSKGVPELDLCKPVENGSPWFLWPIGARTISFRWETPDSSHYRYLYLVPNPVGWWTGFASVILAIGLLAASAFLPLKQKLKNPLLLLTVVGLYLSYMLAISRLTRVMYLYHYFLPLLFSYILIGLVFLEIRTVGKKKVTEFWQVRALLVFGLAVFAAFHIFRPLTYYEPLNKEEFLRRSWVQLWDMKCVGCEKPSVLAKPKGK